MSPAKSGATGKAGAGEEAAVQPALRVRQLRTVVVVFQAEPFQAGFGHQPGMTVAVGRRPGGGQRAPGGASAGWR